MAPQDGVKEFTDPSEPVQVAVGEEFQIRLRSATTAGYLWAVVDPKPSTAVLEPIGDTVDAPESTRPGASAAQLFRFRAVGRGATTVLLRYARPWEEPAEGDRVARFEVAVG
jgi:predicted secreted protein